MRQYLTGLVHMHDCYDGKGTRDGQRQYITAGHARPPRIDLARDYSSIFLEREPYFEFFEHSV